MVESETKMWMSIILSLVTVFPLLVFVIPTPNTVLITNDEYIGLNFEIFLRLKVYLAIFLSGIFSSIIGADLRKYRSVFIDKGEESTGWLFSMFLDIFVVMLVMTVFYSVLIFVRILVEDYDNAIIEFIRFLDLGYPFFFFSGASLRTFMGGDKK